MAAAIVIAAIVCLFIPGVNALVVGLACGKLMLAMAWGALVGAGVGGLLGGTMSYIAGGSFWEGLEQGAFDGAIAGLISSGMAFAFTVGAAGMSLTFGQTVLTGAVSGGSLSLIGDLGDMFIKGTDLSWGQMLLNTVFSAAFGAVFAGAFYGLSKGFAALKLKLLNGKANLPEAVGMVDDVIEGAGGVGNQQFASNEEAYSYYKDLVKELDVSTGKDTATFYSGKGNRELAEEFASLNGKTTLEMTSGGNYLDDLQLFEEGSPLTTDQATEIWKELSKRYAEGASGNTYGFTKGSWDGSIFNTIEYPALQNNSNVTNVFTELFN